MYESFKVNHERTRVVLDTIFSCYLFDPNLGAEILFEKSGAGEQKNWALILK